LDKQDPRSKYHTESKTLVETKEDKAAKHQQGESHIYAKACLGGQTIVFAIQLLISNKQPSTEIVRAKEYSPFCRISDVL
jgi:hypothetical protein